MHRSGGPTPDRPQAVLRSLGAVLANKPYNYEGWLSGLDCDISQSQVPDEGETRGAVGAGECQVGLYLVSILCYLCRE